MRSSAMACRFGAFSAAALAGVAVLVFHTAAYAQQTGKKTQKSDAKTTDAKKTDATKDAKPAAPAQPEAQAQQEMPPGYSPPPGYPNPPPQGFPQPPAEEPESAPYYYAPPPPPYPDAYPPPPYYYHRRFAPPPPMHYYEPLTYRPFFFGVGLGVSGLAVFPNQSGVDNAARVGVGYDFRFGFGISPRWSLVLSADGATAYFDNNVSITETIFAVGPQLFVTPKLYVRAGIGAASRTYDYGDYYPSTGYFASYYGTSSDSGFGGTAAIGFEFVQSYHVALALEACATVGYYPNKDTLSTYGINFVLNLF